MHRLMRPLRGALVGALFLVGLELAFRALGVFDPTELFDPYLGFRGTAPLYRVERLDDGTEVWRTSPNKRKMYQDLAFPVAKEPRELRVFTVGGSSIQAAFYRRPPSTVSDFLERYLSAALPDRRVRVVNSGGGTTGSIQNLEVVREVLDKGADLILVYPEGGEKNAVPPSPGGMMAVQDAESPARVAVRALVAPLRVYCAARELTAALGPPGGDDWTRSPFSRIVAYVLSRPFGPDSFSALFEFKMDKRPVLMEDVIPADEVERAQRRFGENLREMCDLAAEAGTRLAFVYPQRNLESSFYLRFHVRPDEIRPGMQDEWEAAYDDALEHKRAGRHAEALAAFDRVRATYVEDRDEILAYYRAECLTALGRHDEALAEYALPMLRHPLRKVLEDVAAEKGVPLLDPFPELVEAAGGKAPGHDFFIDSFHPLPRTHNVLARAITEDLIRGDVVPGLLAVDQVRWTGVERACLEIVWESTKRNVGTKYHIPQAIRRGDYDRAIQLAQNAGEDWLFQAPVTLFEYGWVLNKTGRTEEARALFERAKEVLLPEDGTDAPDLSSRAKMIELAFAGDGFAYF